MPFLAPPLITLLTAALPIATAGVGIASGIEGLTQGSGGSSTPPPAATSPPPLTPQQNMAQQAAVGSALPTLQSMTGGSLSPEYSAVWAALNQGLGGSGSAGNVQSAINQFFGLTAPGSSGLASGGAVPGTAVPSAFTNDLNFQGFGAQ